MVECSAREARLRVTGGAILRELALVRIHVATGTARGLPRLSQRRRLVTRRTGEVGVFARQREIRPGVIELPRPPRLRSMTGTAGARKSRRVRVLMAARA